MEIPYSQGGDPRGDARADHPQRPEVLLHPPARLPRRRPDGPVPARLPGRGHDRGLGVGRLPRRRGQAERHPRQGLLLAAHQPRLADPARQGHGPVPQLRAGQDRGRQGRLRGGDPARPRAAWSARARARTSSSSRTGSISHAGLHELDPRRHQPPVGDPDRARPRLRGRRARHRPRRALPGRRDLHDRHGRRADAAARGRRPARRRRPARPGHARGPERVRGRAARPRGALRATGWTWCPRRHPRREPDPDLRHHPARRDAGRGDVALGGGEAARRAPARRARHPLHRGRLPGLEPEGGRALRAARAASASTARRRARSG